MNAETKRHIDAARQILVGAVPNPSSQIDQITNALIYKFMDDMDQAAIKHGGEPSFFVKDLKDYAWTRLMDSRIGNQERMNIYCEALLKFSQSKQLPSLFREIFRSSYLPYRSPEVLGLFLREIDYFDYSHPEELGNAYEYLLSILGSQGDAGQFRTPRHIIDFMVKVVNPSAEDKVLDPACGTGGFLVSAYKHILEKHDGQNDPENKEKPLTPDQRKNLMNNFEGYDIDPGMVRIAQVNMYLHQFKNPQVYNYDTLSMDDRWADKFSVILANPPFMSPKGGVATHQRFSIQSSRSEVLFVDYIMNHLRPKGRAGIIVPEGIIFQSGTAHKQLRKNLIEDGLFAVVSLPSGVFNPYAGVKTSILLFDNEIAKSRSELLFAKIENDGFSLGAQRRPIQQNDLPEALDVLKKWKEGKKSQNKLALYIKKSKIIESGDFNLSADRYRTTTDYAKAKWPMVELGKVCDVSSGNAAPQDKKLFEDGKYPFFRTSDVGAAHLSDNLRDVRDWLNEEGVRGLKLFKKGTILFPKSGASTFLNHRAVMGFDGYVSSHLATITPRDALVNSKYIYHLLLDIDAKSLTSDQAYPSLKTSEISKIKIPLLPLEIQEQIVKELNGYSAIIVGARQIVQNWKPKIDIDPEWKKLRLSEAIESTRLGIVVNKKDQDTGSTLYIKMDAIKDGLIDLSRAVYIDYAQNEDDYLVDGDFIYNTRNAPNLVGKSAVFHSDKKCTFNNNILRARFNKNKINSDFLGYYMNSEEGKKLVSRLVSGTTSVAAIYQKEYFSIEVPAPDINVQNDIVEKIESERVLVESAKKLMEIYEQKTRDLIAKLWE